MPTSRIDNRDRELLIRLQANAREPLEQLAEAVALSVPAVQRRVQRLRERGLIQTDVALIDLEQAGLAMHFIVLVEFERERGDQVDAFRRKARAEGLVEQCYYITGEADFVLVAHARDMDEYEALTRRLFFNDPNVRRFRTSVVMGRPDRALGVDIRRNDPD